MIQQCTLLALLGLLAPGSQDAPGASGNRFTPQVVPEDAGASWDGHSRVVHEWGTFTTVRGSRGETLHGLSHDELDLPEFVHDVQDFAALTGSRSPKMETPVLYFYSPKAWRVEVDVAFPRGLITRWYPAASEVNHGDRRREDQLPVEPAECELKDGYIRWGTARDLLVLPPGADASAEPVEELDPWLFTRDVHANWLQVCNRNRAKEFGLAVTHDEADVFERFLFYRGLGEFELPLVARALREEWTGETCEVELELINGLPETTLRHLFLVHVDRGRCGWKRLHDLAGTRRTGPIALRYSPLEEATEELVGALTDSLARTGLYLDEAFAMARTWQHGYFQEEGLRLLYVLPESVVEAELPLAVRGRDRALPPDEIVRTFVARVELLSPEVEAVFEKVVHEFLTGTGAVREHARLQIQSWGRFRAPYLAAVLNRTEDPRVSRIAQRLLRDANFSLGEVR